MTSPKNTVPDVHFPHRPLVADTTFLIITQKQLTMFETMIFGSDIVYDKGGKAPELMLGKISSVSQPGHWRSISLFTPRDAQSDSRIFFNYLSPPQIAFLSLMTKGYYA